MPKTYLILLLASSQLKNLEKCQKPVLDSEPNNTLENGTLTAVGNGVRHSTKLTAGTKLDGRPSLQQTKINDPRITRLFYYNYIAVSLIFSF